MKKTGVDLIAEERQRQIDKEGWTADHDDSHYDNNLAVAAAAYALPANARTFANYGTPENPVYLPLFWPFDPEWWKPSPNDRIKELKKAGALIAAEIDRLLRQEEDAHKWVHNEIERQ